MFDEIRGYFKIGFHGRSRQYERCWLDAEDGERFAFDCVFPDTGLGLRTRTAGVATVCFGLPAINTYVQCPVYGYLLRLIYSPIRLENISDLLIGGDLNSELASK